MRHGLDGAGHVLMGLDEALVLGMVVMGRWTWACYDRACGHGLDGALVLGMAF